MRRVMHACCLLDTSSTPYMYKHRALAVVRTSTWSMCNGTERKGGGGGTERHG